MTARLRWGAYWGDACILNISSQGMMIQTGQATPEGSIVELHRGDHVIVARVVWRQGPRAGLQTEEKLPVEQIMATGDRSPVQLIASSGSLVERRTKPRLDSEDARELGRRLEFVAALLIVLVFALLVGLATFDALSRPIAQVEHALTGGE